MRQERIQSILDACLRAETKLQEIRQLLLEARPEAVDRCHNELQQTIAALGEIVAGGSVPNHPPIAAALERIRRSARALKFQADYASNVCFGWLHIRLGRGYSERGLPLLAVAEPGSSFEA